MGKKVFLELDETTFENIRSFLDPFVVESIDEKGYYFSDIQERRQFFRKVERDELEKQLEEVFLFYFFEFQRHGVPIPETMSVIVAFEYFDDYLFSIEEVDFYDEIGEKIVCNEDFFLDFSKEVKEILQRFVGNSENAFGSLEHIYDNLAHIPFPFSYRKKK